MKDWIARKCRRKEAKEEEKTTEKEKQEQVEESGAMYTYLKESYHNFFMINSRG